MLTCFLFMLTSDIKLSMAFAKWLIMINKQPKDCKHLNNKSNKVKWMKEVCTVVACGIFITIQGDTAHKKYENPWFGGKSQKIWCSVCLAALNSFRTWSYKSRLSSLHDNLTGSLVLEFIPPLPSHALFTLAIWTAGRQCGMGCEWPFVLVKGF